MSPSERVDPVDVTWLRMDRPTNLMVIVGILLLAGPVNVARLERTLATRLLAFPRFGHRVETHATGSWWCDDPQFDLSHHIKRVRLPGRGGKAELERFVADLASQPLDGSHPLWQFHIVEHYAGGVAVVARIHHGVADGIALVGVVLSLTDERPDGWAQRRKPVATIRNDGHGFPLRPILDLAGGLVGTGLGFSSQILQTALGLATHPARAAEILRNGTGVAAELAYLLVMPNDSPTRFKGKPSGAKRVAWTDPVSLPEVKAASRALGCSVNDILLAAVAGALNAYLKEKGDATEGVEVRALVPIDLRPPGSEGRLGNRFGILALELPVGIENPLERLRELRRRMLALKSSYEPSVTLGLLAALGNLPQAAQDQVFDLLLSRATAVMTNVPGPQRPLYLAGSEVKQILFWVPQPHDIAMGVSILSFNGQVQFGLMTDAAMVPDPQVIVAGFKPEFEKLLYFVLMEASETTSEPFEQPEAPADATRRTKRRTRAKPPSKRTRAAR
ncbi:MAG: wax ester/triacylglycerol synthase family O-acyltransferase [Xanthobacteraceae bacterium]